MNAVLFWGVVTPLAVAAVLLVVAVLLPDLPG